MYELIPNELKKLRNWVCWRAEPDPRPDAPAKIKKIPINPKTGGQAMSNSPDTWSDFDTAVMASENFAGIGFMFSGSGYFGVDLDKIGAELKDFFSGRDDNIAGEFVNTLQSYTELSQSGTGIHIICKGSLPEGKRRKGTVEMYDSGRFFVMTGNYCTEYVEISECSEKIKPLHAKYLANDLKQSNKSVTAQAFAPSMDVQSIIERAKSSANGEKFSRLYSGDWSDYNSQSEADMAFCNILAFWCGGDTEKMDIIYRSSGLMRDKWDRRQSGSTYGRLTLNKAAANCDSFYGQNIRPGSSYGISISPKDNVPKKIYSFDDTGNAQRIRDYFGDILRYSYTDRKWLFYRSGKWNYDNIGFSRCIADEAVELMAQERLLCAELDEENGGDMEKQFAKHYKKSRSFTGKTNMLHEAEHYEPITPSMLDRQKAVLNCKNGMADLKSGTLMPHDRLAFITKITRCGYNADAPEPLMWKRFLNDIFSGDLDLIRYIQKAVGYSLTGSTSEQCAFFLFGTGRNGKSTFLEIIRCILGDYATNIQPQTIMVKPNSGNAPNSDIARLKGARFVTSVEPNEGMRIDEGLLKQLTGDDVVTARKLFAEEFEFKPEFKLWMATNHKPIIRGTDTGIWRRIHLIPFKAQIPENQVDRNLKYKLAKELEGILRWAVDGCRMWQSEGLAMPKAILDAVREYRHEMDVISAFTDNCCIVGEGEVKASQLYAAYSRWADENNEYKMSNTKFGTEMQKRCERVKKSDGCLYYKGVSLDNESYSVSVG